MSLSCVYQNICSGCQYLGLPYEKQRHLKISELEGLLSGANLPHPPVVFESLGEDQLRDRLDFTWQEGQLGLFAQDRQEIVDIEICRQLSPALQAWLTEFRRWRWPFRKASFRLRVGPGGEKGLWIDAANVDIKALLEEKNLLSEVQTRCFVEIGQRRKVPVLVEGHYKLYDPEPRIWFQSWYRGKAVDTYSHVGSFTQPSLRANRRLCEIIAAWSAEIPAAHALEFGAGNGNLSFALLSGAAHLSVCEIDQDSLGAFRRSLQEQGLQDRVSLLAGDFQKHRRLEGGPYDLVLCNPPRSGLKDFIGSLQELSEAPRRLIYMSCYPESLVRDLQALPAYGIREIKIIDQFPQTRHYEVLCLLERKEFES